jgi:hypothetical protein
MTEALKLRFVKKLIDYINIFIKKSKGKDGLFESLGKKASATHKVKIFTMFNQKQDSFVS